MASKRKIAAVDVDPGLTVLKAGGLVVSMSAVNAVVHIGTEDGKTNTYPASKMLDLDFSRKAPGNRT